MRRRALCFLLALLLNAQAEQTSPSPIATATATPMASRGLTDFAKPLPLVTPTPATSPTATPQFELRDSWARLVGKSFNDVLLEANRAFDTGDYDRAIDINSFALTLRLTKGQAAVATMNRGNAYAAKGDYEKGLRDLDESLTLDARNAGAYVNRAIVLQKQGDSTGALKDYAEALRMDPKQWQAYFNRGRNYAEEGEFDNAIADLSKVIQLRPQLIAGYIARATVLLRKSEYEKALADCDAAIRIDPKTPEGFLARARVFAAKRDYARAEEDIARAKEIKESSPELRENTIAWLRATLPDDKLRNGKEAVQLALAACQSTQWKQWRLVDTLAAAYAESGDFEKARQYQQQVLNDPTLSAYDRTKAEERLHLYERGKPYRDQSGF